MFARPGGAHHDAVMKEVWQADIHHLATRGCDGLVKVSEPTGDAVLAGKGFGFLLAARIDGHDFRFGHKAVIGLEVDVGNEPGAEQGDLGLLHYLRCQRMV